MSMTSIDDRINQKNSEFEYDLVEIDLDSVLNEKKLEVDANVMIVLQCPISVSCRINSRQADPIPLQLIRIFNGELKTLYLTTTATSSSKLKLLFSKEKKFSGIGATNVAVLQTEDGTLYDARQIIDSNGNEVQAVGSSYPNMRVSLYNLNNPLGSSGINSDSLSTSSQILWVIGASFIYDNINNVWARQRNSYYQSWLVTGTGATSSIDLSPYGFSKFLVGATRVIGSDEITFKLEVAIDGSNWFTLWGPNTSSGGVVIDSMVDKPIRQVRANVSSIGTSQYYIRVLFMR